MANKYYTQSGTTIELAPTPFAGGGEGSIYKITSGAYSATHCVKLFSPEKIREKKGKLEYMIQSKASFVSGSHHLFCWPEELVFKNQNVFTGYVMRLALPRSRSVFELTRSKLPFSLDFATSKFDRSTPTGMRARMIVCCNILQAVYKIHDAAKCVMIDCKPQNLLFTDNGSISITDVDSFQITTSQNKVHFAEVITPEYSPPESETLNPMNERTSTDWDKFSITICLYEILLGIHPYAGTANGQYSDKGLLDEKIKSGLFVHGSKKHHLTVIPPPHGAFSLLPDSIQRLFQRTFDSGHDDSSKRPDLNEWYMAFNNAL